MSGEPGRPSARRRLTLAALPTPPLTLARSFDKKPTATVQNIARIANAVPVTLYSRVNLKASTTPLWLTHS